MANYTHRREGGDLIFRIGEVRRIEHAVAATETGTGSPVPFTVDDVTCTIYDRTGTPVTSAASGDSAVVSGWTVVSFLWNTAGRAPGDYSYALRVTVDGEEDGNSETLVLAGSVSLVPVVSRLDRWVRRVQDVLLASPVQDAAGFLSERQYRENARHAAEAYSRGHPRRLLHEQATLAGRREYELPAGWVEGFSQIEALALPAGEDPRWWAPSAYEVDGVRRRWMLQTGWVAGGEVARVYYTAPHRLDDYEDTIPDKDFEAGALYAAGLCLLALANQASGTSGSPIGAEAVEYRTKEQQYRASGREMIDRAEAAWGYRASWSVGALAL